MRIYHKNPILLPPRRPGLITRPALAYRSAWSPLDLSPLVLLDVDSPGFGAGQYWRDRSGHGNDFMRGSTSGADANDFAWSPLGAVFDGIDDYAWATIDLSSVKRGAFTFLAIARRLGYGDGWSVAASITSGGSSTANRSVGIGGQNGELRTINNGNNILPGLTWGDDYHFIALRYGHGGPLEWINPAGVTLGSVAYADLEIVTPTIACMGAWVWSGMSVESRFNGCVSTWGLFPRALAAADIAQMAQYYQTRLKVTLK